MDVAFPKRGSKRPRENQAAADGDAGGQAGVSKQADNDDEDAAPAPKRPREIQEGCIVVMEGLPADIAWHDLRDLLGEYGDVRFWSSSGPSAGRRPRRPRT